MILPELQLTQRCINGASPRMERITKQYRYTPLNKREVVTDAYCTLLAVPAESLKVRSFGMIQIMAHQRNRGIHSGQGFLGSFDAP